MADRCGMTTHVRAPSTSRPHLYLALALGLAGTACFSNPTGDSTTTGGLSSFGGVLPWPDTPLTSSSGGNGNTTALSTTTYTTTSGAASSSGTSGTGIDTGTAPLNQQLRLSEIHPDPDGKDGGPGSPEFLEFVNTGDTPAPLAPVVLTARSWPTLDASALGLQTIELLPGETVVLERYADVEDVPDPPLRTTEHGYALAFRASDGLRNADGGVHLALGSEPLDVVQYGQSQAAPFDDPTQWSGSPAPVPGAGESLCRISMAMDLNNSEDWELCPPSPGAPPSLDETGTDSEGDGTSSTGSTTGATTWGTWGTWDTWDTWATGGTTGE